MNDIYYTLKVKNEDDLYDIGFTHSMDVTAFEKQGYDREITGEMFGRVFQVESVTTSVDFTDITSTIGDVRKMSPQEVLVTIIPREWEKLKTYVRVASTGEMFPAAVTLREQEEQADELFIDEDKLERSKHLCYLESGSTFALKGKLWCYLEKINTDTGVRISIQAADGAIDLILAYTIVEPCPYGHFRAHEKICDDRRKGNGNLAYGVVGNQPWHSSYSSIQARYDNSVGEPWPTK